MDFIMKPIGVIHTPLTDKSATPIQSKRSEFTGSVEIFSEFAEGLDGIEAFSYVYLIYGFHLAEPCLSLKVKPFLDDKLHGIFATRYPCRPNPIGFSIVRVLDRKDNVIEFRGADMLDNTPLFDIKPYVPDFDIFEVEKTGWYMTRKFD